MTHRCFVEEVPVNDVRLFKTPGKLVPVDSLVRVVCIETDEVASTWVIGAVSIDKLTSVRTNLRHWCPARHVWGTP